MFYWIYNCPTAYMGALFALAFLVFTWVGLLFFRPIVRSWIHTERRANDMVGFALSSFSVFYGLLLGLLAVAAYQNFSTISDNVDKEAGSLAALYRDLGGYPQPLRGKLQDDLREYTSEVIEKSWPLQRQGIVPDHGSDRVTKFFDDLLTFNPAEKGRRSSTPKPCGSSIILSSSDAPGLPMSRPGSRPSYGGWLLSAQS